jgi:hypothetical protein
MHLARGRNEITAAMVVLTACAACMSRPVAAPGRLDPRSASAIATSAASLSTAPLTASNAASSAASSATSSAASSAATPAPSGPATSMRPTEADIAGFVNWRIVPCPDTSTCMYPTQAELNALVLYSAATGAVIRPVASASSGDVELPVRSDFDPQWRYFVRQSGQAGAAAPTVNALMRVSAAGGEPQVVVANLVQPKPLGAADDYVVSADGSKVAYLDDDDATSIAVATIGNHPTQTVIDVPADDSMLQLVGWLPDDRTIVAVLPNEDATPARLVELDTTAPFSLKTIFAPPWPTAYSHDGCPDEELAGAVDGDTIALAVGACSADQEPTPQLYFVDAAGNHQSPIAVVAHPPYYGGFSVYDMEFVSDDEVVVLLAHQDCYGPGVWVAVTTAGASHYIPVKGDGCGG